MPLKPFIIAIKGQLCCTNIHYDHRILQTLRLRIFIFFSIFSPQEASWMADAVSGHQERRSKGEENGHKHKS
jgi:hypothetical protein